MIERSRLYIDGEWIASPSAQTLTVTDASTAAPYAVIPAGCRHDADAAVAAARAAFADWSCTPARVRADHLQRIAGGVQARSEELALTISSEVGTPLKACAAVQVGAPVQSWRHYAQLLHTYDFEARLGNSLVVREPVGVVAAITPWNYPLHQITQKLAPALAGGCTVVLKPSEVAPINAFILAEVVHEAGLPRGVFNLVTGLGPVVGEALVGHPDVDMVSFTGSTQAGRRIGELASQSIKRVSLELGGKGASIILEGADLDKAVRASVAHCYLNSGQTCAAWTRLLVPAGRLEEARSLAKACAESFVVGHALQAGVKLGPLACAAQRDRVLAHIREALAGGAELVTGGLQAPEGAGPGYFVRPTVFVARDPSLAIAREEVFGPVLTLIPYGTQDDAVRIANDSIYGLSGAVWARTDEQAMRIAHRLRAGQVDINGGKWNPLAPFGGYKQSGRGRENGVFGLEEFLEYKAMQLRA